MKVAILSRHAVANYGSLFQAYALQTAIMSLGCDAVNIDYIPLGEKSWRLALTSSNNSRWSGSMLKRFVFILYQVPSFTFTFYRFKQFRKQYLIQTSIQYNSKDDLIENIPQADIYCTGSDQVWNKLYDGKIDDVYFMNFLPDNCNRFSYAASFGGNEFSNSPQNILNLKKYSNISVRESSGLDILNSMGICGKQVLDPTLLLSPQMWEKLLPNKRKKEPYVLIYQLRANKAFDEYVEKFAKQKELKLIRVSMLYYQIVKCGHFKYSPKPEMFLWYIKNADYFFTDSFHGTCFAINFGINFTEILPGRYNERNQSLLELLGLSDRILTDYEDYSKPENTIEYSKVYDILECERSKSLEFLKKCLEI